MLLKGKTAIITGCSRGIGQSTVELFATHGADVWACYRKESPSSEHTAIELSEKFGVKIKPVYFDLNNYDAIRSGMRTIVKSGVPIDVLVNNAGMVSENASFLMTPIESIRKVFEVNFFAQLLVTQLAVRGMLRQKQGSIINVSSIAGLDGGPGQLEYVASKAALIGATKKLARELAKTGIRVNTVAPGITETEMLNGMSAEIKTEVLNKSDMKRAALPVDIARAILFFASDLSSHLTGQVLRVDGGM